MWAVRKGDRYVGDRFRRVMWTHTLVRAATFLTQEAAERAAEVWGGEAVLVEMKELTND